MTTSSVHSLAYTETPEYAAVIEVWGDGQFLGYYAGRIGRYETKWASAKIYSSYRYARLAQSANNNYMNKHNLETKIKEYQLKEVV